MTVKLRTSSSTASVRNSILNFYLSQGFVVILVFNFCTSSFIPVNLTSISESLVLSNTTNPDNEATQFNTYYDSSTDFNHLTKERKEHYFGANCSDDVMTIMGYFGDDFKGRIYATDYPDEIECGTTVAGLPSNNVTFHLPLGQCGVQMTIFDNTIDSDLRHEVTLYIQYSAYLQQIIDEKVAVSCVEVKGIGADESDVSSTFDDENKTESKSNSRQGRRMKQLGRNIGLPKSSSKIGEAIMEIISGKDPSPKSKKIQPIAVGEYLTLVISTKVLRGFDARVINCTTHDGSRSSNSDGSRNQPILDSAGCSIDKGLVPNFRRRRLPVESLNRLITLHFTSFPAFKFPERDHLHIKCQVAYCQGPCPQESCDSANHYGTWREKYGRIADVLMEISPVVNSIEVLSPDLDSPGDHHYERHQTTTPVVNAVPAIVPSLSDNISHMSTDDTPPQQRHHPPASHYSKSPPNYHQYYNSGQFPSHGANQIPERQMGIPTGNGSNVCISPGTVIMALVILGLVLVVSITAILWFALKRSEVKKYSENHAHKSAFSNPAPAPYYRFNHW